MQEKSHYIIYIIYITGHFEVPRRRAIEVVKEVLTSNLCQILIFSSIGCTKADVIFASVAQNSRNITKSITRTRPTVCRYGVKLSKVFFCAVSKTVRTTKRWVDRIMCKSRKLECLCFNKLSVLSVRN